ncbi:MAG TPA: hypothetical protein O0Y15_01440 [Methanocorpusculum sp.]|nr:hypothetical protein [Methanocorpusculum sp.]
MIPLDEYSFKYVGRRESRTEDDIRRAREAREGFERSFLRPGTKVTRLSNRAE